MRIFIGKANLEAKEIGINHWEWECIVFALNEIDAENKVRTEIENSPHMANSSIKNIKIKEVAVIA